MYAETVVIYADILFLINFSLDYLCLFITSRLLNLKTRALRLIIASAVGGGYAFVPYFMETSVLSLPLHLLVAGVICFLAFGRVEMKKFALTAGTFIATSALMGGLITAVYSLTDKYTNGIYGEVDSASFFVICVASAVVALSYGFISRRKIHTPSAEIKICFGDEECRARLLADSGNLVTEPFSALPVIIVSSSALPLKYSQPESLDFPLPIRVIPFSTSAGSSCFLGYRPKRLLLLRLGSKPKEIDAFIAVDTTGRKYSGYDGIIPTSLL